MRRYLSGIICPGPRHYYHALLLLLLSRAVRGSKHLSRYSFYSILQSSRVTIYREVVISHRITFYRSLLSTFTLPPYITQSYRRHVMVLHLHPTVHSRGNMGCTVFRERLIFFRSPFYLLTLTLPSYL